MRALQVLFLSLYACAALGFTADFPPASLGASDIYEELGRAIKLRLSEVLNHAARLPSPANSKTFQGDEVFCKTEELLIQFETKRIGQRKKSHTIYFYCDMTLKQHWEFQVSGNS